MRRWIALSVALVSPGLLAAAVTFCCAFAVRMPGCAMPASCEQKMLRSANCCASFEARPATAALDSAQFKPAPPPAHPLAIDIAFRNAASLPAFSLHAVPAASPPPLLNLRI